MMPNCFTEVMKSRSNLSPEKCSWLPTRQTLSFRWWSWKVIATVSHWSEWTWQLTCFSKELNSFTITGLAHVSITDMSAWSWPTNQFMRSLIWQETYKPLNIVNTHPFPSLSFQADRRTVIKQTSITYVFKIQVQKQKCKSSYVHELLLHFKVVLTL